MAGLPDDIARQREAGMPVSFPASALPADPVRRASVIGLMHALGVEIVEEQPVSLSAHELLRVHDCAAPNCANEAAPGDHLCSEHAALRASDNLARQAERDTKRAEREANPGVCKIDGCDQPANTRYDRGPLARICDAYMEAARAEASETSRRAWAKRKAAAAPPAEEPERPAAEPSAPPTLERIPPTLEHAARAARLDLSPAIRSALADLLDAVAKELRAA